MGVRIPRVPIAGYLRHANARSVAREGSYPMAHRRRLESRALDLGPPACKGYLTAGKRPRPNAGELLASGLLTRVV